MSTLRNKIKHSMKISFHTKSRMTFVSVVRRVHVLVLIIDLANYLCENNIIYRPYAKMAAVLIFFCLHSN